MTEPTHEGEMLRERLVALVRDLLSEANREAKRNASVRLRKITTNELAYRAAIRARDLEDD